ncbi:uncharacterized protein LOC125502243 [Athalia rosae]|uniref:uncharacterized protein LOC125502243 n=1 Tax=Athalia rosae TaxID=37344 RepID=UPI002033936A|nr:uncharacterized protein LOC125502243 [Athalia rosae]
MGTMLVYGATLLVVASFATASKDAVSVVAASTANPTTTTKGTPASDYEATLVPKLKRGVVDVGTNIWANEGNFQLKSANPSGASPVAVQQSQGSLQSPAQANGRATSYGNLSSRNPTASSYSSPSESYIVNGPSYGNTAQSYGGSDQTQNSGYSSYYAPQRQSTGSPSPGNYAVYGNSQPLTSSAQQQNGQGVQIQNAGLSTPYYNTGFSGVPQTVKSYADKQSTGQYRAGNVQTPYEQQNVPKTQITYSPSHQSDSYVVSNIGSYSYPQASGAGQGYHYAGQRGPVFSATSQINQNTPKGNSAGQVRPEFAQMYAPNHHSASSFVPEVQSTGYSPATVDFNGKRIPLPVLQLQSAESFPGFAQALQNQPLILDTDTPYQAQNDFSFLADFSKSLTPQAPNILPFLHPQQSNQPQVLPVRSANGSPQFPQYKGASINTSPSWNLGQQAGSYEPLRNQPQLHFAGKPAPPPPPPPPPPQATSSIVYHPPLSSRPVAEIRDDVEVIKRKKRPPPPKPDFDDDDDLDDGYKAIEREYGRHQDDAGDDDTPQHGKHLKDSDSDSEFKLSRSFPFKSYDEKFSKYSKPSSDEDSSDEDRPVSRYRSQSSAEEDDDYDGHSSTHHADYRSHKARPGRYEDAGEESQKHERHDDAEEDDEHDKLPTSYKAYGKDFEQEFEDSYRKELPKNRYVHRKEVPEIDEPSASSYKSYSNSESAPKSSRYASKERKGYHQSHDGEPEESTSYDRPHNSQKYRRGPKNGESDGYGSNIRSYNNKSPKVVHEESFGYRTPEPGSYSKYKKTPTGDTYSSARKSPKMDSYLQASRSSYKSPKNDKAFENGDSYSYSSGSSWKSDKKSPEPADSHGHATTDAFKTLAQPDHASSFYAPAIGKENFFYSKSEKIVRDLTGI